MQFSESNWDNIKNLKSLNEVTRKPRWISLQQSDNKVFSSQMSFLLRQSLAMASFPEVVLRVHVIHCLLPDAHVNCDEWLMTTHLWHLRHWLWLMSELIVKCAAYFPLSVFSLLVYSHILASHLLNFSSHTPVFHLCPYQSSILSSFSPLTSLVSCFSLAPRARLNRQFSVRFQAHVKLKSSPSHRIVPYHIAIWDQFLIQKKQQQQRS